MVALGRVLRAGRRVRTGRRPPANSPGGSATWSGIWAERNLLLRNTPWPRRAHLELVGLPGTRGCGSARTTPPPKVRVRAYEWVVADPAARDGWRPLRWADLTDFEVTAPQTMTVSEEGDWAPHDVAQAAVVGVPRLPLVEKADLCPGSEPRREVGRRGVHRLPTSVAPGDGDRLRPARRTGREALDEPDPPQAWPSRRRTLTYRGLPADPTARGRDQGSTSGTVRLTREPNGDFSAEVTGLKESVAFVVRAEDFRTESRDIILVPPPMLTRLARVESQPAYLFHPAPQVTAPTAHRSRRDLNC